MGFGIIARRGDDFEFAFAAVEEAVKNTLANQSEPNVSQKWETVSKRRNRIEQEIRGALYQWTIRLSPTEWGESLKACLSEKRNMELGLLSRQEAFSRNKSPLYFIELLQFIRRSGQYNELQESGANIFQAEDGIRDHSR